MIDVELVAGGGGDSAEVKGVGTDDEVTPAEGAFDDAGIDDVRGTGAACVDSGGAGLDVIDLGSGEDAGQEGLTGAAAPALGHDGRRDDWNFAPCVRCRPAMRCSSSRPARPRQQSRRPGRAAGISSASFGQPPRCGRTVVGQRSPRSGCHPPARFRNCQGATGVGLAGRSPSVSSQAGLAWNESWTGLAVQ